MSAALDGRVAVVIGGGRGIGRAHALALAERGASVIVNDLGCGLSGGGADPEIADAVAETILARGGRAIADAGDIAQPGAAGRLMELALSRWGRVDAVISAAGIEGSASVIKMDDALLVRALDVHVRAGFAICRAAARAMIDHGTEGGSIVLHTAPVAFFGAVRRGTMAATAGAIVGLVRCAAIELRRHGVRVNAIAPTARTRANEQLPLFSGIAEDSMGPETVAPLAVFLASDASRDVTGEVIGVAGARYYQLGGRESPGWFAPDGERPSPSQLAAAWAEVTRP